MRGEVHRPADLGEAGVAAWRDLAGRALEPNPFFEPEFILPAVRHLGGDEVRLVVAADEDGWQACMPVARRRWRRLGIPALGTWLHIYSFLGTPLVAADRSEAALEAAIAAARGLPGGSLLVFDQVGGDGPVARALAAVAGTTVDWEYERATLERREENDYLASMRSHHRREYQRQRRRIGRETEGEVETVDRSGDPAAPGDFLALERLGWKGREGTAMAASGSDGDLFRAVCEGFAADGRLQMLELRSGGRRLAMKCNLLAGDGIFCFKIAYDEEFARYSPGVQLELATVDVFHDGQASWMDSCAQPENQMINRLWPDRRRIVNLMGVARTPRGLPARTGIAAVKALGAIKSRRDQQT